MITFKGNDDLPAPETGDKLTLREGRKISDPHVSPPQQERHMADDKMSELRVILNVLRELVEAVEEQEIELDPTARLVRAIRDAKSWLQ